MTAWTKVPKPQESSVITSIMVQSNEAEPFGLLAIITSVIAAGPPISSIIGTSIITGWGDVSKPIGASWTLVAKPTS